MNHYPNDCTTNFSEWTTVSVTPITGYVNIFDDPEAPGGSGYYVEPSPAVKSTSIASPPNSSW